ncbi:ATP-binding protein [soil metagenome]
MHLSLPRDAQYVGVMRGVAGSLLEKTGVPREAIDDIQLAVGEACANAVNHAGPSKTYDVVLELDDDRCEVEVVDRGPGMLAGRESEPDVLRESGRGLNLLQALVDDLQFTRRDDATRVRFTKGWPSGRSGARVAKAPTRHRA